MSIPVVTPAKNVIAYALVRFSSIEQKAGSSAYRQLECAKAECARRGWQFDESLTVADLGLSAFRGKNFEPEAALGKFLRAARNGLLPRNAVLIVENPDRFSRACLDMADSTFWGLVKCGVSVLFLSSGLLLNVGDENDAGKRAILMFEWDRAHKYCQRISEFVTGALDRKLQWAKQGLAVDLGVHRPAHVDFIGESKEPGRYEFNKRAEVLRQIVQLAFTGESQDGIATQLVKEGVPTPRGGEWSGAMVSSILHSPLLVGTTTLRGVVLEKHYPPIITDEEFARLQALLNRNATRRGGPKAGQSVANLFRNRCKCAACGKTITSHGGNPTHKKHHYFACAYTRNGTCSDKAYLRMEAVEMDFFGSFLMSYPDELISTDAKKGEARLALLEWELALIKDKLKAAVALFDQAPVEEVADKVNAIKKEQLKKEEAIASERKQNPYLNAERTAIAEALAVFNPKNKGTVDKLDAIARDLQDQLEQPAIREKLVNLVPSIISGLVIDLKGQRYAVIDLAGRQREWRDVTAYSATLSDGWARRSDALGQAHRQRLARLEQ